MLTNEEMQTAKLRAKTHADKTRKRWTGLLVSTSAFLATWILIKYGEWLVAPWSLSSFELTLVSAVCILWLTSLVGRTWLATKVFEKYYVIYIEEAKVMQ